jgi:hypothetical protein
VRSSVVAGVGTGKMPWALRTVPPPSGSDVALQRAPVEGTRDAAGGDDVEQRIPIGELVEVHLLDRNAVHASLRVAQQSEQRKRVLRVGADSGAASMRLAKRRVRSAAVLVIMLRTVIVLVRSRAAAGDARLRTA